MGTTKLADLLFDDDTTGGFIGRRELKFIRKSRNKISEIENSSPLDLPKGPKGVIYFYLKRRDRKK